MRVLPVALTALALLLPGCLGGGGEETYPTPAPGNVGPAWSFVDTDGVTHGRDAPAGNATVLFFMASWCSSCRSKTGDLGRVHADYAGKGVRFYSLSFDSRDNPDTLRSWKSTYGNPWPHGVDPSFATQRTFGVTSQSSVVLLDDAGNPVKKWGYGSMSESGLRATLNALFTPTA